MTRRGNQRCSPLSFIGVWTYLSGTIISVYAGSANSSSSECQDFILGSVFGTFLGCTVVVCVAGYFFLRKQRKCPRYAQDVEGAKNDNFQSEEFDGVPDKVPETSSPRDDSAVPPSDLSPDNISVHNVTFETTHSSGRGTEEDTISPEQLTPPRRIYSFIEKKPSSSLGFSIAVAGLYVTSVDGQSTGGVEDVEPGDEIVSIDDVPVEGMTEMEAYALIAKSGSSVKLEINKGVFACKVPCTEKKENIATRGKRAKSNLSSSSVQSSKDGNKDNYNCTITTKRTAEVASDATTEMTSVSTQTSDEDDLCCSCDADINDSEREIETLVRKVEGESTIENDPIILAALQVQEESNDTRQEMDGPGFNPNSVVEAQSEDYLELDLDPSVSVKKDIRMSDTLIVDDVTTASTVPKTEREDNSHLPNHSSSSGSTIYFSDIEQCKQQRIALESDLAGSADVDVTDFQVAPQVTKPEGSGQVNDVTKENLTSADLLTSLHDSTLRTLNPLTHIDNPSVTETELRLVDNPSFTTEEQGKTSNSVAFRNNVRYDDDLFSREHMPVSDGKNLKENSNSSFESKTNSLAFIPRTVPPDISELITVHSSNNLPLNTSIPNGIANGSTVVHRSLDDDTWPVRGPIRTDTTPRNIFTKPIVHPAATSSDRFPTSRPGVVRRNEPQSSLNGHRRSKLISSDSSTDSDTSPSFYATYNQESVHIDEDVMRYMTLKYSEPRFPTTTVAKIPVTIPTTDPPPYSEVAAPEYVTRPYCVSVTPLSYSYPTDSRTSILNQYEFLRQSESDISISSRNPPSQGTTVSYNSYSVSPHSYYTHAGPQLFHDRTLSMKQRENFFKDLNGRSEQSLSKLSLKERLTQMREGDKYTVYNNVLLPGPALSSISTEASEKVVHDPLLVYSNYSNGLNGVINYDRGNVLLSEVTLPNSNIVSTSIPQMTGHFASHSNGLYESYSNRPRKHSRPNRSRPYGSREDLRKQPHRTHSLPAAQMEKLRPRAKSAGPNDEESVSRVPRQRRHKRDDSFDRRKSIDSGTLRKLAVELQSNPSLSNDLPMLAKLLNGSTPPIEDRLSNLYRHKSTDALYSQF